MAIVLTLESVVVASDQQVAALLGDEVVILGLAEGSYFALKGVGTRIWALLQQPVRLGDVADRLVAEFDVDRGRCERDLLALAGELEQRRLIEVRPGP